MKPHHEGAHCSAAAAQIVSTSWAFVSSAPRCGCAHIASQYDWEPSLPTPSPLPTYTYLIRPRIGHSKGLIEPSPQGPRKGWAQHFPIASSSARLPCCLTRPTAGGWAGVRIRGGTVLDPPRHHPGAGRLLRAARQGRAGSQGYSVHQGAAPPRPRPPSSTTSPRLVIPWIACSAARLNGSSFVHCCMFCAISLCPPPCFSGLLMLRLCGPAPAPTPAHRITHLYRHHHFQPVKA